ncbi:GfdT protein [Donghicola sp. B5-SW-15]|uniref:GfdT protein n=2 Tax=Donghicola mangrovi TaxID=2729614 RepID=A0A850Q0Z2_9RHOB|nr:FIST N-terminal domain-containing protein [Donghicola mangrovi]NVO22693.1 GfdT protein [Donghicola mangrovi]
MRVAQVACDQPDLMEEIRSQLGDETFALVCLFAAPCADFKKLIEAASNCFGGSDVLACTTAGELGADGYEEGQVICVGFPARYFTSVTYSLDLLNLAEDQQIIDSLIQQRMALAQSAPDRQHEFALLLVDGLSMSEENLTTTLASGLGPMPLFGGSAGDGVNFRQTWLSHNGEILENAAVLALVRSSCPVKVFSHDNLAPTEMRMVVTAADPEARTVQEINAEPAAAEYARLLGKDPNQLDPFTFAEHPVVVRLGDSHHVRAIQRVNERGELVFFSAINEGMVLTLAEHRDIVENLQDGLERLSAEQKPDLILGCDCILRRIAADQRQKTREVSALLSQHHVIGFSTYGEQFGALHVNQTLTGVAIYPPNDNEVAECP